MEAAVRRHAANDAGTDPESIDIVTVAAWLTANRDAYRPGSYNTYKNACRRVWNHDPTIDAETRNKADDVFQQARRPQGHAVESRQRHAGQRHTRKRKRLPPADLTKLCDWLHNRAPRARYATLTATLLLAGRATGLRPGEWPHAWLEAAGTECAGAITDTPEASEAIVVLEPDAADAGISLAVDTLKTAHGHGARHVRRLNLDALPTTLVQRIHALIQFARRVHASGHYDTIIDHCRRLLERGNHKLWPKRKTHYTLSSARHEFAAHAKHAYGEDHAAALLGHASSETARAKYGRHDVTRHGGTVMPLPEPDSASLHAVRTQADRVDAAAAGDN